MGTKALALRRPIISIFSAHEYHNVNPVRVMVLAGNIQAHGRTGSVRPAMSLESEEQLDFDVRIVDNGVGERFGA